MTKDILYATDNTGSYRADLFQPSSPGVHPALVMIHGGSWRTGHKSELHRLGMDLAQDGYTCLSIDYDTHPHSFPASWQESRAAVAFLREHALQYHVDPKRIAVLGTSAGGQLAALLALAPEGPKTPLTSVAGRTPEAGTEEKAGVGPGPLPPAVVPVAAAVLFNGGYDLHPRHWLLRRYLGGDCQQVPEVCDDASPDFHVHPGSVPLFVGHGTHDHLIPYTQATTLVSLLQAAHSPVTVFRAEGAGHSYWRKKRWYSRNLASAKDFLANYLASPASNTH